MHRDYLGSILAITNAGGAIVEKRHFDAWGNLVFVKDGQNNDLAKLTFFDRGYTGHEHLQGVALIHMNGRLYDPVVKRFLAPDNFVQDPTNTQNFNRYGYVLNNPLVYVDPSGESIVGMLIVGAIMGGLNYVFSAALTGADWNIGGFGMAMLTGAAQGAFAAIGRVSASLLASTLVSQSVFNQTLNFMGIPTSVGIKLGDWKLSVSPIAAYGQSFGAGVGVSAGYTSGNWDFSVGVSGMRYSNYNGFGVSATEIGVSPRIGWDDGKTGFAFSSTWFYGTGGMSEFNQRTSALSFRRGDFSFRYENDGSPFNYAGKLLSNDTDMYRTAAISIGVGDFSLQTNMFTGKSGTDESGLSFKDAINDPFLVDKSTGHKKLGVWNNSGADKYRLGTLTLSYLGFNVGANSEHVRNVFQNKFAHTVLSPQPGFRILSSNWRAYLQYKSLNKSTLW